ncbi:glutathione S-transferase [Tilletiopsis washingtonensis]|uniref:Glutathione S-transferase n=1 Tax=Tilletiopsis washingtonensis TaxID=58919 RepID=A0A316ZEB0_9BASI|nr:glutathione S-transferase [Tilletiopsis washingtonensis]PWO00098.1 glutathione S-transferase [Tilletiopsis washingtonensis]
MSKPLQLYTAATPNGQKVSVFLEELKQAYGKSFPGVEVHAVDIMSKDEPQKQPDFLKINPNGRIPALVDPNHDNFAVFESAAILLWLEKNYDPDHLFSWPSSDAQADKYRSEVLQWVFWTHGGQGPMQGQANHFRMQAVGDSKNVVPYAVNRYVNETKRLYSVLETRLEGRDWLVGDGKGKISLADFNALPWAVWSGFAGIPRTSLGENTQRWIENFLSRPATMPGMKVPSESPLLEKVLDAKWAADMPDLS